MGAKEIFIKKTFKHKLMYIHLHWFAVCTKPVENDKLEAPYVFMPSSQVGGVKLPIYWP